MELNLSFEQVAGYNIVSTPLPGVDIEGAKLAVYDAIKNLDIKPNTEIGTQLSTNTFMDSALVNLFHSAYDSVCFLHTHFTKQKIERAYQNSWLLILDPEERYEAFHNHIDFHKEYNILTNYTWTYYIEVPDNCEGKEGKLAFKYDPVDGKEELLEVKEGHLYIFPSAAWHQPYNAPNASNKRITAAGNINISNSDKCFLFNVNNR